MGSFKLIFLIPFFTFGQSFKEFSSKHNDAVHFYTAFGINEASYQIQSYAFPKWKPARKILVSNLVTLAAIFGKEFYDSHKANPTGVSKPDILNGIWSIPVYDIWNVCRRDFLGHDVNKLVY